MSARRWLYTPGGALRAPWRLLVFAAVSLAAALVILLLLFPLFGVPGGPAARNVVAYQWGIVVALLLAHYVSLRRVDKRPWSDAAMGVGSARPRLLAAGTLLGGLAVGIPSGMLLMGHWLRARPAPPGTWWSAAAFDAAILLPAALNEELVFRGYPFAVLRDAWGWRATLLVTSVAFGLLHLANPGASALPIVMVILAGVFLGAVVLVFRSLFAAWMAHFAWNWVMVAVLHSPVSGMGLPAPNYEVIDSGPDWATGGPWGPEGGLGAAAGMLGAIGVLTAYARRRVAQGVASSGPAAAPHGGGV